METNTDNLDDPLSNHYIDKSNWLRSAVLGANDAILSTASIAIGVAAGSDSRESILLATLAGLAAGALSMTASRYVATSSQIDTETADIEREKVELIETPHSELLELARIYEKRGLKKETALLVAKELTEHDALAAHIRDELGITDISKARPFQDALAAGAAFILGGGLPLLVTIFLPVKNMEYTLYGSAIISLIILGIVTAKTGGSSIWKAIIRITLWGTAVMGTTALVGYLFGMSM